MNISVIGGYHMAKAKKTKNTKKVKKVTQKKSQKPKIDGKKKKVKPNNKKKPTKAVIKAKKPTKLVIKEKKASKNDDLEKKKIKIFIKEKKKIQKTQEKATTPNVLEAFVPPKQTEKPPERAKVLIPSPSDFFKMIQDFNHIILDVDENINFEVLKVSWELLYSLKSNIDRKIRLFREVESKKELDRIFNALK